MTWRVALIPSFLLIASLASAVTINGDTVAYDKNRHYVEATGSVEVLYQDARVTGQHIIYNTSTESVFADEGFVLDYAGVTMEGLNLTYLVGSREGTASNVQFTYGNVKLGGARMEFSPAQFHLSDAYFTTCDNAIPHYHVTAKTLDLYPDYGWIVSYWAYFWAGKYALLPMPTYIYDMRADENNRKNIPPFPDIGSNSEDGFYISETMAWHFKRELFGSYNITWAGKKGLGGGVATNYTLNDVNRGNFRLNWNGVNKFYGGVTHQYFFGPTVNAKTGDGLSLMAPALRQRQFDLTGTVSFNERINYQRISYLPYLALNVRKVPVVREEAKLDGQMFAGDVDELNNVRLYTGGGNLNLSWQFPEARWGVATPYLTLDDRYYSNSAKWERYTGGLDIVKRFDPTTALGLRYSHYFSIMGQSPFLYEVYRYRPADRLIADFSFKIGETGAGLYASYYLDCWQPEDIDGTLFIKMHCYNLIAKYRAMRNEFQLGFSLIGG